MVFIMRQVEQLPPSGELFDRAYAYIRENY